MNNYNQNKNQQRLYWAFSKPLRWLGLTLDEWVIALLGICPGLFFLNDDHVFLGVFCLLSGIIFLNFTRKNPEPIALLTTSSIKKSFQLMNKE